MTTESVDRRRLYASHSAGPYHINWIRTRLIEVDHARCDEGYRCEVCGRDVEAITESDLYLRFVLGEVPLERLHLQRERHIRCNPALAQFIVDDSFESVTCGGPFDKRNLDSAFVVDEENRVTSAWRHLQNIPTLGLTIAEYPLSFRL